MVRIDDTGKGVEVEYAVLAIIAYHVGKVQHVVGGDRQRIHTPVLISIPPNLDASSYGRQRSVLASHTQAYLLSQHIGNILHLHTCGAHGEVGSHGGIRKVIRLEETASGIEVGLSSTVLHTEHHAYILHVSVLCDAALERLRIEALAVSRLTRDTDLV